jgi:GAF domain-containing protein
MLFTTTSVVDFLGMAVSLWLALYLLGRGFSSRITLRGVVVLGSLALFFLGAYIGLYEQISGLGIARALFLIIGMSVWNDLTHKLLPGWSQKQQRWRVGGIYVLGLVSVILLPWGSAGFAEREGSALHMPQISIQLPDVVFGLFQVLAGVSILYNFRVGAKAGAVLQNRYFFAASLLAVSAVAYGALALAVDSALPKLVPDALILGSVFMLGLSAARYQVLVERRAILQDFPISALAVFSLSNIYLFIAWQMGLSPVELILVTALAILTHSMYSLVREFLERLRIKDESAFREQLRRLEASSEDSSSLKESLQRGLGLLCQMLGSTGAFIAVERDMKYVVLASHHSIPVGEGIPYPESQPKEIYLPPAGMASDVAWLVPALQNGELAAILGIGGLKSRLQYTEDDLDLLVEAADRVGTIIYMHSHRPAPQNAEGQTAAEAHSYEADLRARSEELLTTLVSSPDPEFIKLVEDGLRNLTNFISLGQSSLPGCLGVAGETHVEKGKGVQQQLMAAIEALRPAQDRPGEPFPREWHSYMVLHDAYWERIPNHEIMSKLYISEGTFHRTRRAAVRSVARALLEKKTVGR